jgi:hypothetical protein
VLKIAIMRKLCVIFTFIIIPIISKSQAVKDSITIYVENRVEAVFILDDFDLLRKDSTELINYLSQLQSYLPGISSKMNKNVSELIEYQPGKQITVEVENRKDIFLIQDGKAVDSGLRDKAILELGWVKVIITGKDLSAIQDIDLGKSLSGLIRNLPEKTRNAKSLFYQDKAGKTSVMDDLERTNRYGDYIELKAGMGLHHFKNKLLGDFTFQVDLTFKKKGILEHSPYISTNLLYDYGINNKVNINTFLNLGYRWNRARPTDKENPFGVEIGYLIGRQGAMFDKNTFRFGLNWSPAKGVIVSPQVYFMDNFRQITPGIRIGFGL